MEPTIINDRQQKDKKKLLNIKYSSIEEKRIYQCTNIFRRKLILLGQSKLMFYLQYSKRTDTYGTTLSRYDQKVQTHAIPHCHDTITHCIILMHNQFFIA